jgi:hypothetical protein
MLGYMQALRQQPMCIFNEFYADEHRAGYIKGRDMYTGDILKHNRRSP